MGKFYSESSDQWFTDGMEEYRSEILQGFAPASCAIQYFHEWLNDGIQKFVIKFADDTKLGATVNAGRQEKSLVWLRQIGEIIWKK